MSSSILLCALASLASAAGPVVMIVGPPGSGRSTQAEGLQKKAEAWKNFNEAAVINMVVEKMPDLAQAFATQLAGIDKINIIEMGNGSAGSGGIGKVMSTVGGGMTAMLSMLKDEFGIDIARLMQAKTEAAAEEADKKAGKR